jgi:hypothetical protein
MLKTIFNNDYIHEILLLILIILIFLYCIRDNFKNFKIYNNNNEEQFGNSNTVSIQPQIINSNTFSNFIISDNENNLKTLSIDSMNKEIKELDSQINTTNQNMNNINDANRADSLMNQTINVRTKTNQVINDRIRFKDLLHLQVTRTDNGQFVRGTQGDSRLSWLGGFNGFNNNQRIHRELHGQNRAVIQLRRVPK